MATQEKSREQEQQDWSMEDRIKREVAVIFGRHQLVTADGEVDVLAIVDLIFPVIENAVVTVPGERIKVGITQVHLMERFFPEVPDKAKWAEYEDKNEREFHTRVYKAVAGQVKRVLDVGPKGLVQSRLALNGSSMVLCRMAGASGSEDVFYVTRNHTCIQEDNHDPVLLAAKRALDKVAALTAMAMGRVPEQAVWFHKRYNAGAKTAISSGVDVVRAVLDAGGNTPEGGTDVAADGNE